MKIRCCLILLLLVFSIPVFSDTLYWNRGRGYKPFRHATEDGILIDNQSDSLLFDYFPLEGSLNNFTLKFRAKNIHGNPAKKYKYVTSDGRINYVKKPHWGFFVTSLSDTIVVTLKNGEKFTLPEPLSSLDITFFNLTSGKNEKICLTEKINPYTGDNLWNLTFKDNFLNLSGGDSEINQITSFPCNSNITGFGFFAGWGDKVLISDIKLEKEGSDSLLSQYRDLVQTENYFSASDDPLEGHWMIFDRELDEDLLKPGGNYILSCVRDKDNYIFLYREGAEVNSSQWFPGDVKAILQPSPFPGIYNVEWFDAMKKPMSHDIRAQKGEGETLLIQFPYQDSKIRLRKLPSSSSSASSRASTSEATSDTSSKSTSSP